MWGSFFIKKDNCKNLTKWILLAHHVQGLTCIMQNLWKLSKVGIYFKTSHDVFKSYSCHWDLWLLGYCCDIAAAQINYPSFKHNTQDSIKQARGRSHEEDSSQIFMLDDMQFRGVWTLFRLKQKKIENYQTKFNKIRKLSREQTLVASTHPPTEIRTDHGNETSIYILNIYLFLALVS